ncbi:hypothetical protein 7S11_11 [uncultured Caudovirales phage]|uniref:Uncharacterized protein n=1 Tax=uncultured Caudovirales phage TaxID=2100421 RepID=A0A2H4IZP1_9CAUD|nr:hypothetical protein 7S11_11 [uncultured Caudovirales phage]
MSEKPLRAVSDDERRTSPPSLLDAVETGDVLDMLLAQRRLIAEALTSAAENTRPQFNNELNKLHVLIREEQARRAEAVEPEEGGRVDNSFDAKAI